MLVVPLISLILKVKLFELLLLSTMELIMNEELLQFDVLVTN